MNRVRPCFFVLLTLLLSECASTIPLKPDYLVSPSRLGFIVIPELTTRNGAIGVGPAGNIISSVFTPVNKYTATLNTIAPHIDPMNKVTMMYLEAFESKGRKLIPVNFSLNDKRIADFNIQNTNGLKKYYEKDLRFFRGDLEIDELLIVKVQYGLEVQYAYGIETSKSCYTSIKTHIVNLRDNSIIYRDNTGSAIKLSDLIESEMNNEITDAIIKTTDQSVAKQKEKYKNL
jgi:hypothetical protein